MDITSYLLGRKSSGGGSNMHYVVVEELPTTGEEGYVYLVPKSTSKTNNYYDEYMYINNDWELIGNTEIDLSDYQKTIQYAVVPNATADNLGKIIQYIGTTTASYTNGYFYECVSDGQDPATYSWSNINVQTQPEGCNTYLITLPTSKMQANQSFYKNDYPELYETLQKAVDDYFAGKLSIVELYWVGDNRETTSMLLYNPSNLIDAGGNAWNYNRDKVGSFRGILYPRWVQETNTFEFYTYPRLEKNNRNDLGYTTLTNTGSYISVRLNAETKQITNPYLTITDSNGNGVNFLSPNANYTTPYTPQYPGSPANKKYVDDSIASAITDALGGSY